MSERHGVQEATLRNWANLGYITSCRMGNQLFLDDESLTAYLEAHKRLGLQADYLAKIVEEKKLERDFIISDKSKNINLNQEESVLQLSVGKVADTRLTNVLYKEEIRTVGQLLELVSGKGWRWLLKMEGVGRISYDRLLSNLQLAGVVDESLEQILSGRSDR